MKAIEDGADTLFDIVAYTYANVDRSFWIPAASNVRLHVDHLAQQDKLPEVIFIIILPIQNMTELFHIFSQMCVHVGSWVGNSGKERDFE